MISKGMIIISSTSLRLLQVQIKAFRCQQLQPEGKDEVIDETIVTIWSLIRAEIYFIPDNKIHYGFCTFIYFID